MNPRAARTIAMIDRPGHVAHKPKGVPYAHGSNREFVRDQAKKRGVIGVDIDITLSLSRTPYWNHWLNFIARDAWFDPRHRISPHARIDRTPDLHLRHVKVNYQGARRPMLNAAQAARWCHRFDLVPCYEMKYQPHEIFDPDWYTRHFVPLQNAGLHPVIMTLPKQGMAGLRVMEAAHEAGLPTMWLWRGLVPERVLVNHGVDLVKSRPGRGIYRIG